MVKNPVLPDGVFRNIRRNGVLPKALTPRVHDRTLSSPCSLQWGIQDDSS